MQVVHRLHYDCKLSFNPLGPGKGLVSADDSTVSWTEADIRAFAALMRSACNWSDLRRFREILSAMERPQQTAENSQKQASEKAILATENYVIYVAMTTR